MNTHKVVSLFLLLILSALAAPSAGAVTDIDAWIRKGGLFLPKDLPFLPSRFSAAKDASVRLGNPSNGMTCSAVILSDLGYVATAAHCIPRLLEKHWNSDSNNYYIPQVHLEHLESPGFFRGLRVFESFPTGLEPAPSHIRAEFDIDEMNLKDARIVWLGRGILNVNEANIAKVPEAQFRELEAMTEDVAILHFTRSDSTSPLPCIQLVESRPKADELIWAIGFPVRGTGVPFGGYTEAVSIGRVRGSLKEDPILQEYALSMDELEREIFWSREARLWQPIDAHILLTSVDGSNGSSGGMMIDARGRLAAIFFSMTKVGKAYNASSAMGVDALKLRERVSQTAGEELAGKIFHCPSL